MIAPFALPDVGEKLVIVGGAGVEVKLELLVDVPPAVVTVTGPLCVPDGTVTASEPSRFTVNIACAPPMLTLVAHSSERPCTVMTAPAMPDDGEKLATTGASGVYVKAIVELPVPDGVVTVMFPDDPQPTIAVIWLSLFTTNDKAGVLPKLTAVVPVKLVPVMAIEAP
jgi:hypothetical protein